MFFIRRFLRRKLYRRIFNELIEKAKERGVTVYPTAYDQELYPFQGVYSPYEKKIELSNIPLSLETIIILAHEVGHVYTIKRYISGNVWHDSVTFRKYEIKLEAKAWQWAIVFLSKRLPKDIDKIELERDAAFTSHCGGKLDKSCPMTILYGCKFRPEFLDNNKRLMLYAKIATM